jgi:hypothetical protein
MQEIFILLGVVQTLVPKLIRLILWLRLEVYEVVRRIIAASTHIMLHKFLVLLRSDLLLKMSHLFSLLDLMLVLDWNRLVVIRPNILRLLRLLELLILFK